MCDCRKKLKDLAEFHKWCSRNNRYETVLFDRPVETTLDIICDKLPEIKIDGTSREPETISKEIVKMIVDEFVSEIIVYKEEPICETQQEEEEEDEEDDTVELTDISPEELLAQEEEEKRIRDELALIQLTKLTKKRIRTKK